MALIKTSHTGLNKSGEKRHPYFINFNIKEMKIFLEKFCLEVILALSYSLVQHTNNYKLNLHLNNMMGHHHH